MVKENNINVGQGSYILITKDQQQAKNIILRLIKHNNIRKDNLLEIVDNGESIKIAQIREIKKKISLKPDSGFTLIVIENANLLTLESSNAILKTLEEPPTFCIMVLITKNLYTLLPTIISRCKKIYLDGNSNQIAVENLEFFQKLQATKFNYQKIKLAEEIIKKQINIKLMLVDWIKHLESQIDRENITLLETIYKFENSYNIGLNQKLFLENLFLSIKL